MEEKNKIFDLKIDQASGLEYLEKLPEGYVEASLDDFHINSKKKLGMIFLLQGYDPPVFYVKTIDEHTTAQKLLPFIKDGHIYIKK